MVDREGKVGLAVDSTERMFGDVCSLKVGESTQCKSGLAPTDAISNPQLPYLWSHIFKDLP